MKYIVILFLLCVGCSKDPKTSDDVGLNDVSLADVGGDAAGEPDVAPDLGDSVDAADSADAPDPTDAADPDAADADPGELATNAEITVGENSLALERAFYGISSGETTTSGEPEYHIEVHRGGIDTCPEQNSPSPSQTVIVTNVRIPTSDGDTQSDAEELVVSFLDFFGDLTDEVILRAVSAELTWLDIGPDPLVFDLEAPLPDGKISGRVVATHCASLDL